MQRIVLTPKYHVSAKENPFHHQNMYVPTNTQSYIKYLKNGNIMLTKGGFIRVMSVIIIMQYFPCLYVIFRFVLYVNSLTCLLSAGVCSRINYKKKAKTFTISWSIVAHNLAYVMTDNDDAGSYCCYWCAIQTCRCRQQQQDITKNVYPYYYKNLWNKSRKNEKVKME